MSTPAPDTPDEKTFQHGKQRELADSIADIPACLDRWKSPPEEIEEFTI